MFQCNNVRSLTCKSEQSHAKTYCSNSKISWRRTPVAKFSVVPHISSSLPRRYQADIHHNILLSLHACSRRVRRRVRTWLEAAEIFTGVCIGPLYLKKKCPRLRQMMRRKILRYGRYFGIPIFLADGDVGLINMAL